MCLIIDYLKTIASVLGIVLGNVVAFTEHIVTEVW